MVTPRSSAATALSTLLLLSSSSHGFVVPTVPSSAVGSSTCLSMSLDDGVSSRRDLLRNAWSVVAATALFSEHPEEAQASYSAYAARERDWEQRQKNGEIHYSSAISLRAQLREIAPQNTEDSKIYCPNGPSSNVSPLMENKCGDRMALFPSVYGRQEDIVGNSIPGFADQGKYNVRNQEVLGTTASVAAGTGGFPKYR